MIDASPKKMDLSPDGNLARYMQKVRDFPMLEAGKEAALARAWQENGDGEAANTLVTSHLRLVVKMAMGYRGYGLPVEELISEGNLGLLQAVRRFDPNRGFRFATYAIWWIRAALQEYVLHSWSLVKIGTTAAQKKLFFNLRATKGRLQAFDEGDLSPEHVTEIAERLNVREPEVIAMNRRLSSNDHSLNAPMRKDGETDWLDWLVDDAKDQEALLGEFEEREYRRSLLSAAMRDLNDRETDIIRNRRLRETPKTLEHLSRRHHISRERVRQIEGIALGKLQKAVRRIAVREKAALSRPQTV